MLKKLLKGLIGLAVVLLIAGVAFVWLFLGVTPLEGDVDHLWELVSNEVDFFVRWPGTQVIHEPLADSLASEPGYENLLELREKLQEITKRIASEVNPQIPGAVVEVDFEKDFLGKEMALAGVIRGNYQEPKPDNFIFLTRIAGYGRFISALQAGFVRDKLPPQVRDRLELVKGKYFKYTLTAEEAAQLNQLRSGRAREESNAIWFGRIKDVLLVSDTPIWIEAAILGGVETLPADTYFETEFVRNSVRPGDVELFVRPNLAGMMLIQHGRDDVGGPLLPLTKILPPGMAGDVTVQATPLRDAIALRFSNNPPDRGFSKVTKQHLVKLYEYEKGDIQVDLSAEGIGRFIPRDRTVGVFVMHADPETLVGLILDFVPRDERENLDEQARSSRTSNTRGYRDYRDLLLNVFKDLHDTHMVVIHRPSAFEDADYSTLEDRGDQWLPKAQLSFTLISRVKDAADADAVRQKVLANLAYLGLKMPEDENAMPLKSALQTQGRFRGKYYLAKPLIESGDWELVQPAYGAIFNTKYFAFSSNPEAMEAILTAAEDENARLVNDPSMRQVVTRLPRQATLACIVRGAGVRDVLWDQVRLRANDALDLPGQYKIWYEQFKQQKLPDDEIDRRLDREAESYIQFKYPEFRDAWERNIAFLKAVDTAGFAAVLGVGPTKQVRAKGYIHFAVGEPEPPTTE